MDNTVTEAQVLGSSNTSMGGLGMKPMEAAATMTPERIEAVLAAAQRVRENPLFGDYVRAVEEYRRLNNTVPDSD
jgi:hypothetical protein